MANHILENARLWLFCDYCLIKKIITQIMLIMLNAARYFQAKDDFEVINEFILFLAYLEQYCRYLWCGVSKA